jgi:hypothetical protein
MNSAAWEQLATDLRPGAAETVPDQLAAVEHLSLSLWP